MIIICAFQIYIKNGNCTNCKINSIIIERKYSQEKLCPSCYVKNIEEIINNTISKYRLFKPKDKIIVALSGGKDSTALLYNLIKFYKKISHSEPLIALTIDEGIRGYRENSIKIAKEFCAKHNINHSIISFKKEFGKSLDEIMDITRELKGPTRYTCYYCALIRRRLLNDHAKKLGGTVLAMGHNLTDLAETFLMNILYKRFKLISSQFFLKKENPTINQYFIKKVSPLMQIPEEEIYLYINLNKINYYASHCKYWEEDPIVRKRVLNFIEDCKNIIPDIAFNLFNGFLELSERLYIKYRTYKYNFCQICGYPTYNNKICSYCNLYEEFT
ncbi:tRNA-5-methyluridine(54) 2-sulfurtransferase [subsurface metagenome]